MRASRIGPLLLALGVVVGAAAGVGLLVGFEPSELPPALLDIAAYKLTFMSAFGLLAAGAIMIRYGRRETAIQAPTSAERVQTPALAESRPVGIAEDERRPRERAGTARAGDEGER